MPCLRVNKEFKKNKPGQCAWFFYGLGKTRGKQGDLSPKHKKSNIFITFIWWFVIIILPLQCKTIKTIQIMTTLNLTPEFQTEFNNANKRIVAFYTKASELQAIQEKKQRNQIAREYTDQELQFIVDNIQTFDNYNSDQMMEIAETAKKYLD